jgi:hypothetical protein
MKNKKTEYVKTKRYLFKGDSEGFAKYRTCERKKKLSKLQADDIIDRIALKEKRLIYYYKCKYCDKYHLTKKEPQ